MPRAAKTPTDPAPEPRTIVADQLDEILNYLRRMERRDRLRTTGGFIRGLLGLIPLILLVWSVWYFVQHGDELLKQITTEAVRQSAAYSQDGLMQQLQEYMQR